MKTLLAFMAALLLSMTTNAQTAYLVVSTDGTQVTFYYDSKMNSRSGTVTQIADFDGFEATKAAKVKKVTFDSSFASARPTSTARWFSSMSNLTDIEGITNLNTSNVTTMRSMFYGCSKLTSLDLSKFNTAKVETMYCMFTNCSSLTGLNLSSFNTAKVTNMHSMFYNCSSLEYLSGLWNFNTSNVETMYCMFYNCSTLTQLGLSNFNTAKVTTMEHLFSKCANLKEVDISSFDTSNVTNMEAMFSECTSLTHVDVSSFNTAKVTNMRHTFNECTSLEKLDLRNFNTSKVTNSSAMFDNCHSLNHLAISSTMSNLDAKALNGVGTKDKPCFISTPEDFSFGISTSSNFQWKAGWFKLQQKEIYGIVSEDWHTITIVYDKMKWLYEDDLNFYDLDIFHCYDLAGSSIEVGPLPPYFSKVIIDSSCAEARPTSTKGWFACMENITSIEGLKYINTSEVTDMEGMFYYCAKLTNIDISHFNTSKVKNMASMFCGCSNLTNLDVTHFDTSKVEDMKLMFYNCHSLTSLNISNFNTSSVTDMRGMFMYCQNLKKFDINNFKTSNVTNMSRMFSGCNLTNIDLTPLNTSKVTDMSRMFEGCNLTNVDLTHFDTSNVTDMSRMFSGCNMTNIDLTHFDTSNVTDMSEMFSDCCNLTNINVNYFNTARVENMNSMFLNCYKLNILDLSNFDINNIEEDPEIPIPGPIVPGSWYPTPYEPYPEVFDPFLNREEKHQISRRHTMEEKGEGLGKTFSLLEGCIGLKQLILSPSMTQLYGGDLYYPASCTGVGTQSSPCILSVPDDFYFGNVTPTGTFQWKGGWFKLEPHPCSITSSTATLHPGGTAQLIINLANNNKRITALQFTLSLPKGVTLAKDSYGINYEYTIDQRAKVLTAQIMEKGEGLYSVVLPSLSGNAISGSSGPIVTLTLKAGNSIAEGTLEGRIKDIVLTTPTYETIHAYPVNFSITVSNYTQGDVSHDGDVNVVDVMMTVNHVLKKDVPGFHPENADIDGNGTIDVVDIMGIVNIILKKPAAAPAAQPTATADRIELLPTSGGFDLSLSNAPRYTALEMTLSMPANATIARAALCTDGTHSVMSQPLGNGLHRVVVYSLSGEPLPGGDALLHLDTTGSGDIQVHDVLLTNAFHEALAPQEATAITSVTLGTGTEAPTYRIDGTRTASNQRGIVIRNGRKISVK